MKSKLSFLILLTSLSSSCIYALTCDSTYQNHPFKRVVIPIDDFVVRCNYWNGNKSGEIIYYMGDGSPASYIPTYGNWMINVPRFWECNAIDSKDCGFEKSNGN